MRHAVFVRPNSNIDADATFLDVGSGYGKVVFHAKLHTSCRCSVGVECVAKRVEISTQALQGLYSELDRSRLDDDLLNNHVRRRVLALQ